MESDLPHVLNEALLKHKKADFIGYKDIVSGQYKYLTYGEVHERMQHFSTGLATLIEGDELVALCMKNRMEWIIADLACLMHARVNVPIHFDTNSSDIIYIINDAKISTVVCDGSLVDLFSSVRKYCPSLKHIITAGESQGTHATAGHGQLKFHTFDEIENLGKNASSQTPLKALSSSDSLASIMYTSGSTGKPKGVMVTQEGLKTPVISKPVFENHFEKMLLIGPLSHAGGRFIYLRFLGHGYCIPLYDGSIEDVFEEFKIVNPTIVAMTPQLFNVVYEEYEFELQLSSKSEKEVQAIKEKYSQIFGNSVRYVFCYGAKLSEKVKSFIDDCIGAKMIDAYGSTEVASIATNGKLQDALQYKLEDVPEMGYLRTDKPYPRGELCVKTRGMFKGYYNKPDATEEAIDEEGYMHTGDIVELNEQEKTIKIIDRKKNIFKLAQGKYVAPQGIEAILSTSSFVEQIFVYGTIEQSYLVAVVVPNWQHIDEFARAKGIQNLPADDQERYRFYAQSERLKKYILEDFNSIGRMHELHSFEIPKDIIIEVKQFTPDNGLMTSTGKISRFRCEKYYKDKLEELYKSNKHVLEPKDEISKMFADLFPGIIGADSPIADYGIDSLQAVRIANAIHKRFGIEIPIKILFNGTITLRDIAALIKDENYISEETDNIDWLQEVNLPADITIPESETVNSELIRIFDKSNILLTGANGFLGVFLLIRLLEVTSPSCKIYCLIRADNDAIALDRLKKALAYHELEWKSDYNSRIVAIAGTFSVDGLGISSERYEWLCKNIDVIYHNGAHVNWMLSYKQLKNDNVIGVVRLIRLATTFKLKPLHFISSVGAVQGIHGIKTEEPMKEEKESLYKRLSSLNGYSSSKWVAEQILNLAREKGFPATIYRPGMIGFSEKNGVANATDWVGRLLRGCIAIGSYPKVEVDNLDEIPVNQVAEIIVAVSQLPEALERYCYHVVNNSGNALHINKGFELIREQLYTNLKPLPFADWMKKVVESATGEKNDPVWPMIGLFRNGLPIKADMDFCNENLRKALRQVNIELKKVDEQLMVEAVKFMQRHHIIQEGASIP